MGGAAVCVVLCRCLCSSRSLACLLGLASLMITRGTASRNAHFTPRRLQVPPPDRISPEEAADAMEVAAITANMVACVAAACGEPVLPETLGMTPAEVAQHATAQQAAPATGPAAAQQQQAAAGQPRDGYQGMSAAAVPAADHPAAAGAAPMDVDGRQRAAAYLSEDEAISSDSDATPDAKRLRHE